MSLQQVTVTSTDDLISKLQTAALAAGWVKATGGVFKARSGDTNEFTIAKQLYSSSRPTEHVNVKTNVSSAKYHEALCGPLLAFRKVWFKIAATYIVVIVETEPNSVRFFSFGYLLGLDNLPSTIPYISAQGRLAYEADRSDLGGTGGFLPDSSMATSASRPGGIVYGGEFYSSGWSSNSSSFNLCGGGIPSDRTCGLLLCGNNTVGSTQLVFNPLIWVTPKGSVTREPVGYMPVRAVSMENLFTGQELELAGTAYTAFSLGSKVSDSSYDNANKPASCAYAYYWGFVLENS